MKNELDDPELERLAYVSGDTQTAGLFTRLVDMQIEVDALTCEVEDLRAHIAHLEHNGPC